MWRPFYSENMPRRDGSQCQECEALPFVNMVDNVINAKNVEALLLVNMGDDALNAKNVGHFFL